jgi:predicted ATPase
MEKLTRLTATGFRSMRSVEMVLGDLTVLIGANGSGKSNFVAFFNMLSFMLSGNLQLYIGRKGGGSSILHYGPKRTPLLTTKLTFEGENGWSEYGCTLAFASPDRLIFTDEHVYFQRPGEANPFTRVLSSGQAETDLLAVSTGGDQGAARVARIFLSRLKGLRVYHFHDTSETAYIRTNQEIDRNRMLLSNGGNLASFLYMLQESFPAHYERIVSTVRLAVPYLRGFDLAPDRRNTDQVQLRWRDSNPDYEFGPHQLSDGSLRAIALITALLQPEDLLPTVIFIDEPELGLHPSAIGIVGKLIKAASAKRQVVVATQSPRLLSECAPEDVVVVEREEDETGHGESRFRRLDKDDLGEWLKDYDLGALYEMNVTGGGPR